MVPRWPLVALTLWQSAVSSAQVQERVEVARVVVDVRVTDGEGRPVRGLDADDFRVRIDGHPARVESVTWLPGLTAPSPDEAVKAPPTTAASSPGRTVVLLFQKDLQPSRIEGLMRMLQRAAGFVGSLAPDVGVAILSFDSHLRLWTDFTTDRARLHRIVSRDIILGAPTDTESPNGPSLAAYLSHDARRRVATPEAALQLVAEALGPLEGAKSLLYVGFGFGRPNPIDPLVGAMNPEYEAARRALVAARVTVFSLDVTDADRHTLESGMREVAEATGGFYVKTHEFTEPAMMRLVGALEGQYVLMVEPEPGSHRKRPVHDIAVNLVGRRARVEARRFYVE